jgi:uncharacterized protein YbcI
MVKLHKEQLGRGPTNARSYFAGPDTLVCTLEDSLLPAERTMVEMGEHQRVRETRIFLQVASQARFIAAVEELVSRKVRAFASAVDPGAGGRFRGLQLRTRGHARRRLIAGVSAQQARHQTRDRRPPVRGAGSLRGRPAGVRQRPAVNPCAERHTGRSRRHAANSARVDPASFRVSDETADVRHGQMQGLRERTRGADLHERQPDRLPDPLVSTKALQIATSRMGAAGFEPATSRV